MNPTTSSTHPSYPPGLVPREKPLEQILGSRPPRHPDAAQDLRGILRWLDRNLHRELWDWPRLRAEFVHRTAREILTSRSLHYAAPCVDLSTVCGEVLKACGYSCVAILGRLKRPLQSVKFQMGIEVNHEGITYAAGFTITSWRLIIGSFTPNRARTHVWRACLPAASAMDLRYLTLFGVTKVEEVGKVVSGYDHRRDLAWFRKTISQRKFHRARQKAWQKARSDDRGILATPGRWQDI